MGEKNVYGSAGDETRVVDCKRMRDFLVEQRSEWESWWGRVLYSRKLA